jgi:hypothetical protein
MHMKGLVAAVTVVALVAGMANAGAAQKRHHKPWYGYNGAYRYEKQRYPDANGWYPHDSNELAVGSRIWFDQMEREGRFGGRRN